MAEPKEEVVLYKMQYPYANRCIKTCQKTLCSWGAKKTMHDISEDFRGNTI